MTQTRTAILTRSLNAILARKWTLLIASLAGLLHVLPIDHALIALTRDNLAHGRLWTLLTGPLLHASTIHLTMDVLGLLVVGCVFEPLFKLSWLSLAAIINIAVGLGVLAAYSHIDGYCGLSALDQGLLAAGVIALLWRGDHLPAAIIGGTLIVKWTFEIIGGLPLMGTMAADPLDYGHSVPLAHAIGGAAAAMSAAMIRWRGATRRSAGHDVTLRACHSAPC